MSHNSESDGDTRRIATQPDSQEETRFQEGSSRSKKTTEKKGPTKKRDTHFLCFPLVTEASVPQLAESLRRFREISTKPRRARTEDDGGVRDELTAGTTGDTTSQLDPTDNAGSGIDVLQPNSNRFQPLPPADTDLQILPSIAHRPPGSYHLTLGVMDLSQKDEMDRALHLLQELDYAEIFQSISSKLEESPSRREYEENHVKSRQTVQPLETHEDTETKLSSLERTVSPPRKSVAPDDGATAFDNENPLRISLTGLSTFPSSKASRVFFAKPSPSPSGPFSLLQFGQAIRRKFREAGFITETRPLVLHATVANMRYASQARGGRTSKGRTWRYGKDRWKEGQVDARELIKCFDYHGGDVEEYRKGGTPSASEAHEYVWAKDIVLNRVAICKMGAENSDDEILGQIYPPIGEKLIFS